MSEPYRTIDLFAGIGGMRRGFELTGGFQNVLSAEIDKYACATYKHLFGDDPYNDVTSESFKDKVEATPYDTLLAGFPCQSFSRAGVQRGFKDKTRGTLFFDVADIIERTRPKTFLLENVDNLFSHDKGETIETILNVLVNDLDYTVIGVLKDSSGNLKYLRKDLVRNSRNFGVPQNRPRIYLMGFDNQFYGDRVAVLSGEELPLGRSKKSLYTSLNEVLGDAEPKYYMASQSLETLRKHRERHSKKGNGFGYMVVNEEGVDFPVSNALLATGGSGKDRNIVIDHRPGISGMKVKGKHSPLNDEGLRYMTPTEWGKLQGFIGYGFIQDGQDKFSFPPKTSDTQMYKQFGNSVTIPAIEELGRFMLSCITKMESQ